MLMKWEDLSVGDIIKINDEIANIYIEKDIFGTFVKDFCFKKLKIIEISVHIERENIYIASENKERQRYSFRINRITGKEEWALFPGGVAPIEIVSLEGSDETLPEYF